MTPSWVGVGATACVGRMSGPAPEPWPSLPRNRSPRTIITDKIPAPKTSFPWGVNEAQIPFIRSQPNIRSNSCRFGQVVLLIQSCGQEISGARKRANAWRSKAFSLILTICWRRSGTGKPVRWSGFTMPSATELSAWRFGSSVITERQRMRCRKPSSLSGATLTVSIQAEAACSRFC